MVNQSIDTIIHLSMSRKLYLEYCNINKAHAVHRFNVLCIVLGLTTNFAVFPTKQLVYTWTF